MSNKKQSYINKVPSAELGSAPPRYQPPPQVTSSGNTLRSNYPPSQPISFVPPTGKDVKIYPTQAVGDITQQLFQPPQYSNPPRVIQPPAPTSQRRTAPAVGLPQHIVDEDPRLSSVEMLKFVRKSDGDTAHVSSEARDSTRRMQGFANETRALKEANQRLSDDNQELRDLCCFLDDDRQKGRKLAREWQRFGRYTASVMRQEVSAYQSKLRELDNKQQDLIKDNLELKELCLYLDEERNQNAVACPCGLRPGPRDDGDGSSSSTNADEPALLVGLHVGTNRLLEENMRRQRTVFNDEMIEYVRGLEQRVKKLEEEKQALQLKLDQTSPPLLSDGNDRATVLYHLTDNSPSSCQPEAVVQALQVLEVREQLERTTAQFEALPIAEGYGAAGLEPGRIPGPHLDDGEKALVREMCNVVWRKLEEGPAPRS